MDNHHRDTNYALDETQRRTDNPMNYTDDHDSIFDTFDDSDVNNNITMNSRDFSTMNVTIHAPTNRKRLSDKRCVVNTINDVHFDNSNRDDLPDHQLPSHQVGANRNPEKASDFTQLNQLTRMNRKRLPDRTEFNNKVYDENTINGSHLYNRNAHDDLSDHQSPSYHIDTNHNPVKNGRLSSTKCTNSNLIQLTQVAEQRLNPYFNLSQLSDCASDRLGHTVNLAQPSNVEENRQNRNYRMVPVRHMRMDYLPRDKIDDKHVISVMGHRIKHKKQQIVVEQEKMESLKKEFLTFARPKVIQGFVSAAQHCSWKVGGQHVSTFNDIRAYISQNKWTENIQKDIHYISYLRFVSDPRLNKWDESIDHEFRTLHNIRYMKADEDQENMDNNTASPEVTKVRGCFTILAVSLKTDYNKRIRKICKLAHGCVIKQRRSSVSPSSNKYKRRSNFKFAGDMVVTTKQAQETLVPSELLRLKEENEELKNKLAVFNQLNKNTTTSTNELVRSKHQHCILLYYFYSYIYIMTNQFKHIKQKGSMCVEDDNTQDGGFINIGEQDMSLSVPSFQGDEVS